MATTTRRVTASPKRRATATAARAPRGRAPAATKTKIVRAKFESATTSAENRKSWAMADGLSARAAYSPEVRRLLRTRARHELENCPLARGIIRKLADFVVGTGPRLQLQTDDRAYNRAVERAFQQWAVTTAWQRKLWQLRYSKAVNGESFGIFFTNPPLRARTPVTLDLRTIEADQVADPITTNILDNNGSDGIVFDDFGNPMAYRILRQHPGDTFGMASILGEYDTVHADSVIHYFTAARPGQVRGVPEIAASLPYLSMRRRFILAVLGAAETAADLAGVVKTQSAPNAEADDLEPFDPIDIERRMLMTLPKGWSIEQFKAEQPTSTLEMFDRVIIREVGRDVNMPYGIAGLDSSTYNFASGKLDQVPWFQTVRIEQDHIEDVAAEPTFIRWFAEASLISGYLPDAPEGLEPRALPPHQWFWDGQDLLDPREAGAKETGIRNGFETHGRIFAKRGEDVIESWEAAAKDLGITLDEYREKVMEAIWKPTPEAQPVTVTNPQESDT